MSRHGLIRLALRALAASRAETWLPPAPDAAGIVVTLHHVQPERRTSFEPNALLSVTPDFLDRFIVHFRESGWRFVSVDELLLGSDRAGDPRRIALTLDDGLRDNAEHAWPVFKRHAVPFTIYVCPGFCDRTAELWWEALERIIAGTDSLSLDEEGPGELATRSPAEKHRAFRLWAKWLTNDADEVRQRVAIRKLAAKYGLDLSALAAELVMDWDEVRAIAADPLCTIGAHTMTHSALARLPADQALREMAESADRIEREIGRRPTTIAFPYGYPAAAGAREAQLAGQAGFSASFTTQPGYVRRSGPRQGVPRVSMNGLYQNLDFMEVLLTPGLWSLRDRVIRRR